MKSDKVTAAQGSVVVRFTRALLQESGNPLLSKTNTGISIEVYSIISSHLDKASVLGYWKAMQETPNVCPNEYKGYYISKQLTYNVSDKHGYWTWVINPTHVLWWKLSSLDGLRATQYLLPPMAWPIILIPVIQYSEGKLVCKGVGENDHWINVFKIMFWGHWDGSVSRYLSRSLSPTPGTHVTEGENQLVQVFFWAPNVCTQGNK